MAMETCPRAAHYGGSRPVSDERRLCPHGGQRIPRMTGHRLGISDESLKVRVAPPIPLGEVGISSGDDRLASFRFDVDNMSI